MLFFNNGQNPIKWKPEIKEVHLGKSSIRMVQEKWKKKLKN